MIGKRLDGRYELIELIGAGGMADIYKARDITEDKTVAVKILKNEFAGSEDFLRRFRNESKAIALLSHPNIVKIFDVGFSDQIQYIVMEYIDGITLTEYIRLQGVLKWKDAVFFTVQILRALQHAHDRGIVHRDIKSQNVMMLSDGTIKVMDFGIARFNRESDKTLSEKAIGSVHYISPEQARGEMTDEKSDIYSVGVMLYEMLTGQKPFDGETPVAIALQHMQTVPKMPREINSSIPEGLEEITLKAMQKEPSQRYQTAGEMMNDIEEFKKDPSIVFEYKYLSADETTKYFDKVTPEQETEEELLPAEDDDTDEDIYDDEDEDEVEERRSPLLPILFAVASVFVIMTAWLIFTIVTGSIPNTSGNDDEMTMPSLINKTLDEVREEYPELQLDIDREYSTEFAEDVIMNQETPMGRTIKKNSIIKITVSDGPQEVEIRDFTNLRSEDAVQSLTKDKLKAKIVNVEDDDVAEGYVIRTDPPARTKVDQGTEVKVYVSLGNAEKPVNVPKFTDMTIEEAREKAEEKHLTLIEEQQPSNEYEEGIVFKQDPAPNSVVNQGSEVRVVVSNGESVTVEYEITIDIPASASDTGTFRFEYYRAGFKEREETRDMIANAGSTITWAVSGSEETRYQIVVTNTKDSTLRGTLLEVVVDYTSDSAVELSRQENPDIFEELRYTPPTVQTTPTSTPPFQTAPPATAPVTTPPPPVIETTTTTTQPTTPEPTPFPDDETSEPQVDDPAVGGAAAGQSAPERIS
ncbi:MAG: Stk1 family PASTA domain-containing Ser/Thr kinase [Eubacterium sp.]|nr:Stk1 family PASTA domain-containing Ser/Thr kinase [Eubacterium sp.]